MDAEPSEQDRRDGDGAGLVISAVFQATFLTGGAIAGSQRRVVEAGEERLQVMASPEPERCVPG